MVEHDASLQHNLGIRLAATMMAPTDQQESCIEMTIVSATLLSLGVDSPRCPGPQSWAENVFVGLAFRPCLQRRRH